MKFAFAGVKQNDLSCKSVTSTLMVDGAFMCDTFNIALFKAPSLICPKEFMLLVRVTSFIYFPIHRRNMGRLNHIFKREFMLEVHINSFI